MNRIPESEFKKTVYFHCIPCGQCCLAKGDYGYVYLTRGDRRKLARHLGLSTRQLVQRYCIRSGDEYYFKDSRERCVFLENTRCAIYPARPHQCITWPFWKENLNPEGWRNGVLPFCPGARASDPPSR
jgi:uncharacterized protein